MAMEFAESKKKRKPLPGYVIAIIVFGSISIIFGIIKGVVEAQTEQSMAQIQDIMGGGSSSSLIPETPPVGVKPVSYKNVSLKIPNGWTYTTETIKGADGYQLYLESPDADNANITWAKSANALSPKEWMQLIHDTGSEDFSGFSPSAITETTYCGQSAYTFSFSCKKLGFTYYAKAIAFKKNGSTVTILLISDLRSKLSKKFGFIEETLTIN